MKFTLVNFQSEEEYNFDTDDPVIIGRGSQFGCSDKKVSRNHGQLQLTQDGDVQLTALHSNPCFIMKNGLPPVIPLTKNNKQILNDGDYIGLLPKSFWYKVVVNKNEGADVLGNSLNDSNSDTETDNVVETKIQIISDNNDDNSKESQPSTSEMEINSTSVPDSDKNIAEKVKSNDSLEERLKALEHTKKLPLYMYEIDDFPEESALIDDNETQSNVLNEDEEICEQHESEETEKCENGDPVISSTSDDNSLSNSQLDADTMTYDDVQNDLNVREANVNSIEAIKENLPLNSNEVAVSKQKESDNNSKTPVCPDSQKRPYCQYEGRCYRKNSQHKSEYCHPGDPDFIPYENRPMCPFGSSCYRRNKYHFTEYQHPKKKSPASNSPKGKRRKKEPKYRDSSEEDDYDLEDPFINDGSSDEFIPSDLDSEEEIEDSF